MKKNNNRYYRSCDPFCFVRNRTLPRNLYWPKESKRDKSYTFPAFYTTPTRTSTANMLMDSAGLRAVPLACPNFRHGKSGWCTHDWN
jgi:hypothetical protein